MTAWLIPPFSGGREERPYGCGQTPPAGGFLRPDLRAHVGVLAARDLRGDRGPLIAALIVIPLTQGWAGLRDLGSRMIRWRVRWYWYALAIGLPLAVFLFIVALNVAFGAPAPSLAQFSPWYAVIVVFAVRLVNPLDGPMGEEPGWRSFAMRRSAGRCGATRGTPQATRSSWLLAAMGGVR
jgi:hypothetical protein